MNAAIRAAISRPQSYYYSSQLKSAFFHSTPVLERKRRSSWESKSYVHKKRLRRMREKQDLLRNVNAFSSNMFTSWHDELDDDDESSRKQNWWFRKLYDKEPRGNRNGKSGFGWGKRGPEFCEVDDDFDVEYVFKTSFGGSRGFSFSFTREDDDEPRWQRHQSSRRTNNSKRSWRSKYRIDDEQDDYTSEDSSDSESEPNQASHRRALGLSPSGPLNLKDVKNAYRTCALKWHPDRHQGATKVAAEAKFKLCSVAYQSLCEKLAVN